MRLLSVEVRNFRVHAHASVEFAPGHTVLVGPNEAGKSTLLEAMYGVLFMHHRAGGQALEKMRSRHGGHPEVALRFEAEGGVYRLTKVFRGPSGSCELVDEAGGRRWTSDEAEEQLGRFTGTEVGRRGQVTSRWEHVWSRQGQSANDFVASSDLTLLRDALSSRDGDQALSTLTQQDDRLLSLVRQRVDANYGKRGKPLETSEASVLQRKLQDVQVRLQRATEERDKRRELRKELARLRVQIQQHEASRQEHGPKLVALDQEIATLQQQVRDLDTLLSQQARATQDLEQARHEVQEDAKRRVRLDAIRSEQEQQRQTLAAIESEEAAFKKGHQELKASAREAEVLEQRLVQQSELATALERRERGTQEHAELLAEVEKHRRATEELAEAESALAAAQAVRSADVDALDALESERALAEQRLSVVAARLTRIAGTGRVLVDGVELPVGEELRVDAEVRVELPDGNVLQVQPGGEDLEDLRAGFAAAQKALGAALLELGVVDLPAARELRDRFQRLEKARDLKRSGLQGMSDPSPKLAQLKGSMEALDATVDKLRAEGVALAEGDTVEALARSLADVRERRSALLREIDSAEGGLESVRGRIADARVTAANLSKEESEVAVLIQDFAERHGAPEAQQAWVASLEQASRDLEARLAELRPAGESLAQKQRERETLAKAMKGVDDALIRDRGECRRFEGQLEAAGGDSQEDVERLEEERQLAQAAYESARLRMEGEKLLADTLESLRSQQQAQREAPLTDAVRRYLGIAFGAEASVTLDQQKGDERSLGLVDRGAAGLGAFAFLELSHGARELVGLAVRLAMAEVMAAEQPDGCMPLVLDDAVTNVDPERLDRVGFMIGDATQRGVQVVLATCETKRTSVFLAERTHLLTPTRVPNRAHAVSTERPVEPRDAPASGETGEDVEAFVAALRSLGGQASTRALREQLDWDTSRFHEARSSAESRGLVRRPEGSRSLELLDRGFPPGQP